MSKEDEWRLTEVRMMAYLKGEVERATAPEIKASAELIHACFPAVYEWMRRMGERGNLNAGDFLWAARVGMVNLLMQIVGGTMAQADDRDRLDYATATAVHLHKALNSCVETPTDGGFTFKDGKLEEFDFRDMMKDRSS